MKTNPTSAIRNGSGATPGLFSILIGRVSTEDGTRISELLDALCTQALPCEIIIADRLNDGVSELIRTRFPEVRLLPCSVGASMPMLRTLALDQARGEFVVVTEDHCVPPTDWLAGLLQAFRDAPVGTVAVGGSIENGVCRAPLGDITLRLQRIRGTVAQRAGGFAARDERGGGCSPNSCARYPF